MDAAIAEVIDSNDVRNPSELSGIGLLRGFYKQTDQVETKSVLKIGATTGVTQGIISDFDMEIQEIPYKDELSCGFEKVISIQTTGDNAFSKPGDSGSIIVDEDGYAVALLFAGSPFITYAIPIDVVLQELDIDLVTA